MLSLPLLVTTLTLAPTGNSSHFELSAAGGVQAGSASIDGDATANGSAVGGQGGAGVTVYLHPITDDDAPPSLQPYLQYASLVHADGGASGYHFARVPGSTLPDNDSLGGYADLSASGYIDRAIYASLSLGMRYRHDSNGDSTTLSLPMSLGAGIRLGDVRLLFGWSVAPMRIDNQVFKVPFWGGAFAQLYAALHRRLGLLAEVDVVDGGAVARGGATGYFLRRFSAGGSVSGGHGHSSPFGYTYDEAGVGVTFQTWAAARVAIALDYSFGWTRYAYANGAREDDYSNVLALTLFARPR